MRWEAVDSPGVSRFGREEITLVHPSPDSLGWGPDSRDTALTDELHALSAKLLANPQPPSLTAPFLTQAECNLSGMSRL